MCRKSSYALQCFKQIPNHFENITIFGFYSLLNVIRGPDSAAFLNFGFLCKNIISLRVDENSQTVTAYSLLITGYYFVNRPLPVTIEI